MANTEEEMIVRLWSGNPEENIRPAPYGAKHGEFALKSLTATLRVIMTAISEVYWNAKWWREYTLGLIDDPVTIDRLPLQAIYDRIYPVGCRRVWHKVFNANDPELKWSGITATWRILPGATDAVLVTYGSSATVGQVVGTHNINASLTTGTSNDEYMTPTGPNAPLGLAPNYHDHNFSIDPRRYGVMIVERTA